MASSAPRWLWAPRLLAAAIMAFVAYLKLTENPADIYIFTTLGVEPWGRYAAGVSEAICAVLLVTPFASLGGAATCGVMAGALMAHATKLGFIVQDDGGLHMILLAVTSACAFTVAFVTRADLPIVGPKLAPKD